MEFSPEYIFFIYLSENIFLRRIIVFNDYVYKTECRCTNSNAHKRQCSPVVSQCSNPRYDSVSLKVNSVKT